MAAGLLGNVERTARETPREIKKAAKDASFAALCLCVRQGALTWRCKSSTDPDGGNHQPNRKGCRREARSEGSGTQIPGPRNTKRIRGSCVWARRQTHSKPDSHPEDAEVESAQKSAEGIVVPRTGTKARTWKVGGVPKS